MMQLWESVKKLRFIRGHLVLKLLHKLLRQNIKVCLNACFSVLKRSTEFLKEICFSDYSMFCQ